VKGAPKDEEKIFLKKFAKLMKSDSKIAKRIEKFQNRYDRLNVLKISAFDSVSESDDEK